MIAYPKFFSLINSFLLLRDSGDSNSPLAVAVEGLVGKDLQGDHDVTITYDFKGRKSGLVDR